jgi:hypothetical protein
LFRELEIAGNVREVSESFKDALGGRQGSDQLKSLMGNLGSAAEKFSTVSAVIERSFVRNEENIDAFLEIGANVRMLSDRLESAVFPSFQDSIEKIALVFDRDGRIKPG